MLRSMIDYLKLSVSTTASRAMGGIILAVPFTIAAAFALAAIYMALRNSYGDLTAAVILAIAFAVIGGITALVVSSWIRHEDQLLEEKKAEAEQSALSSALLAVNPALVLGAGRVAFSLFRRAPVLTAALPIAAGFFLAMASARERRLARANAVRPAQPDGARRTSSPPRPGNSRDLLH
jgi:hypothetical protein